MNQSTPPEDYLVVGTAGHIDHGKTSLIHRLTGVHLDTLPEEQLRHITIALGFTDLLLPSGRTAAFVDVPGHERLVRTMVAGAAGIDAALLCVSALEGVMPQTREHLAILELMGVRDMVVALTFADMVDDELLLLAQEDVLDTLAAAGLEDTPIIPFSSTTGQGVQDLLKVLDSLSVIPRNLDFPFRLCVDRVFSLRGHGTVITGTVRSGVLREGQEVEVQPGSHRARVRGLQVHGKSMGSTRAGLRTALNLNLAREHVNRGSELCSPGSVPVARTVDVRYHHIPGAPPIKDGGQVRLLVGTAECIARARTLTSPVLPPPGHPEGQPWAGYLELLLDEPVPCLPGDRFVLRRASPVSTLGGGTVLDPWAIPTRHRDRRAVAEILKKLHRGDSSMLLMRADVEGLSREQARQRACLPSGDPDHPCSSVVILGDRVLHAHHVQRLQKAVLEQLARFHELRPLARGAHRKELAHGILRRPGDRVMESLLERMLDSGSIATSKGRYRLASFQVELSAQQKAACQRIEDAARQAHLTPLQAARLSKAAAHPQGEDLTWYLLDRGHLVRVDTFLAHRDAANAMVALVRDLLARNGSFSLADIKQATGMTRKHLIPWLEWLDANRVTRRAGDRRLPGLG